MFVSAVLGAVNAIFLKIIFSDFEKSGTSIGAILPSVASDFR